MSQKRILAAESLPALQVGIPGPEATNSGVRNEDFESSSPLPRPNLMSAPPPGASLQASEETAAQSPTLTTPDSADLASEVTSTPAARGSDESKPPLFDADREQTAAAVDTSVQLDPNTFSEWQTPALEPPELAAAAAPGTKSRQPWMAVGAIALFGLLVAGLIAGRENAPEQKPLVVRAQPIKAISKPNGAAGSAAAERAENTAVVQRHETETNSVVATESAIDSAPTNLDSVSKSALSTNSPEPNAGGANRFPELTLQGILFSQQNPAAIVNGVLVHDKDLILGVRIVGIRRSSVVIEYQRQRKTLSLE